MITVKRSDKYAITYSAEEMDLTNCTVRLLARAVGAPAPTVLGSEISDPSAGEVMHQLSGNLLPGDYLVELEVTTPSGDVITFPSRQDGRGPQYETLRVIHDLDV